MHEAFNSLQQQTKQQNITRQLLEYAFIGSDVG